MNKSTSLVGKPALALFISLAVSLALIPSWVGADTLTADFENPPYTLGNINGQNGWTKTGPFDSEVDSSLGTAGFGSQSFRISNAVTSGSFGDQTFSFSLADEAGEVDSLNAGLSGGTRQSHFEASFDFSSTQLAQQPGLFISVSPDRGDGARMSYLGFSDTPAGIDVIFYDVQGENAGFQTANFVGTTVATGLSRSDVHNARLVMDFVDGPSNDVVEVWIDGALVHTGTSWENYFRFDTESQGNPHDVALENKTRTVDSLLFRAGGASAPATSGNGFLFDNLTLTSLTPPPPAPTGTSNSSSISIRTTNRGSISNSTVSLSNTGLNGAGGSVGGVGGVGGRVFSSGGAGDPLYTYVTTSDLTVVDDKLAAYLAETWFFYNDTNDTIMSLNQFSGAGGVNDFVVGPGGVESAQMTLDTNPNPRYNIATYQFTDVLLSSIGSLNYRVYDASASSQTPFFHFNVDFDNSDTWQGRLVMVPTAPGNLGVPANTWTNVDAIRGGAAVWTWSRYVANGNMWPDGNVSQYRTWADIVTAFPTAETRSTDSFLGVRVGHPGPNGETGFVDFVEFDGHTFDFVVTAPGAGGNNGGARAGNGGNGGNAGVGGYVETGDATATAGTTNEGNSTGVTISPFGESNSSETEVDTDNASGYIGNTTTAAGNSGVNGAAGSAGGAGGEGGEVETDGTSGNGGASAGTGGTGGSSGVGGLVRTGSTRSESGTINLLNTTSIRLRN